MDLKKIKTLLEKYYNGDTSIVEEKVLRDYFDSESIDDELIADRDIFLYQIHENDKLEHIPDLSNEIWNSLDKNNIDKSKKNNNLIYISLRIAAGIVIILGSYFILKDQLPNQEKQIQFADTYDNPEAAYKEAKETLLYVSAMLNKGKSYLEPIEKMNEGTEKLNSLTTFNKGLEELSPIRKYNVADKYLKQ